MTKIKKKLLFSFGSVISMTTVLSAVVACTPDPNGGIRPKDGGKYAYEIYLKDGSIKKVTYKAFLEYLRDHPGANTSNQVQYDNQVIK
jgi:hypothetical protein